MDVQADIGTLRLVFIEGSSKESVGKTGMSFSPFNQDTDLKKSPSPFPLPLEREFFSPLLSAHTPPLPGRSAFFSLSRGRGKGEGPFPRHGGGTEQRSETGPRKTYGFQTNLRSYIEQRSCGRFADTREGARRTPTAFHNKAQGQRSATLGKGFQDNSNPVRVAWNARGIWNPRGVHKGEWAPFPQGGASLTLGFDMEPRCGSGWRREQLPRVAGIASRLPQTCGFHILSLLLYG